jgi:hypothetical protein
MRGWSWGGIWPLRDGILDPGSLSALVKAREALGFRHCTSPGESVNAFLGGMASRQPTIHTSTTALCNGAVSLAGIQDAEGVYGT